MYLAKTLDGAVRVPAESDMEHVIAVAKRETSQAMTREGAIWLIEEDPTDLSPIVAIVRRGIVYREPGRVGRSELQEKRKLYRDGYMQAMKEAGIEVRSMLEAFDKLVGVGVLDEDKVDAAIKALERLDNIFLRLEPGNREELDRSSF